jgi:subtilisin family serine protease
VRRPAFIFWLCFCALVSHGALAQLPQVQVPTPSLPGVGPILPDATRTVTGSLRQLAGSRALRADRLFDENRARLDRDPRGELVVRAEVVAIDITADALARALKAQFRVLRSEELADLGVKITILQTPEGVSASRGLKRLRKLDPEGSYDFNHVYLDSGVTAGVAAAGARRSAGQTAVANGSGRVGLIDGGIDDSHEIFRNLRLRHFGCAGARVPSTHGTAVASILVSRRTLSELFAADVYCGEPAGGAVDAVAAAFAWMAREKVAVINVSLVGPRNALLERVVANLVAKGHVIVAAVGNDGPASPPLFPAAYEGVIGVTGVDAKHRVLIEACRGKQVDFAALGADVAAAAKAPDQYVAVRGTSFAAPLVAALLAEIHTPDIAARSAGIEKLTAAAQDLGRPGRDDVYGAGELGSAYK